jgi:CrcB protein
MLAKLETLTNILSVALGGAIGAVLRHLVNVSPLSTVFEKFPLPTLAINISGSFLIGFLLILFADKIVVSQSIRMMLVVGLLGAFTTFSTFELEIYGLIRERLFMLAAGYLLLSVVVGFVGLVAGVEIAKQISGTR